MSTVLQYHEIRGLAASARMLLAYGGIEYENKFSGTWFSEDKAKVASVNALANLPSLFLGDGSVVTQSNAVLFHIGELAGTNGAPGPERSRVDQVISQAADWRADFGRFVYSPRAAASFDRVARSIHTHLDKLENFVNRHGYVYSAANGPTTADFVLFELIDISEELSRAYNQPALVTGYPRLRSIYERFYALPALQPYFAGPLHRSPINGRSAHFGFSTDYLQLKPPADEGGEAKSDKIVVGYWKIRGLASTLRMMCSFAEADFESAEYEVHGFASTGFDRSAWDPDAKPALKVLNPLMNLPYVQCGNDLVTQSNACVLYLGNKFGLLGATPTEQIKVQQIMWETTDMRNKAVNQFYSGDQTPEQAAKYLSTQAKPHFDKFERWFLQNGTKFTASDEVTASDFHLYEMIDQHQEFAGATGQQSFFTDAGNPEAHAYPLLHAFAQRMHGHPKMAAYFASPMHKLPVNNPGAGFGAGADYSKLHARAAP